MNIHMWQLLDTVHTSRHICNMSFPWVMKMILLLNQCWINHWPIFKTHELIMSWNSWALAYLCKDFTKCSLPINLAIPRHIFLWPIICLVAIHVERNLQWWVSRKINVLFRTDLWHFCLISSYHHIVGNKVARR